MIKGYVTSEEENKSISHSDNIKILFLSKKINKRRMIFFFLNQLFEYIIKNNEVVVQNKYRTKGLIQ